MCMNHPTFEEVDTVEKFFEVFSNPSCATSSFVVQVCKTCAACPGVVTEEFITLLLKASDSQMATPWRDHLAKLWEARNLS